MNAFFSMGGYAFYVWSAYGLAVIILLSNIFIPIWQHRKIIRHLALRSTREKDYDRSEATLNSRLN